MDFILRPLSTYDAQSIRFHADNPQIAQFMRDGFPCPCSHEDALALIESLNRQADRVLARAVDVCGYAVGIVAVFVQNNVYAKTADIAYWLGEDHWGKGIMTRAVCQICEKAFDSFNIVRIQAEPFAQNTASHRVLEKAGFLKEGTLRSRVYKNGHIQDALLYSLVRQERFLGSSP